MAITLQAGGKYYIEALHKEAAGGDNLAVGWQTPTNSTITIIPGSVLSPTTTAAPACTASGSILREYWAGIPGTSISSISLGTTPNSTSQLTSFEAPLNVADNYGQRIRGYICAPITGSYTFYIASDDSELWLSSSDNPAGKQKIASFTGWTNSREWTKYPSQKSISVTLQAGQRYYVEALHKKGVGSDNLAVAWQTPTNGTITIIPVSVLSPATNAIARISGEDTQEISMLKIFPNPFEDRLIIALGGLNGKMLVTLIDVVGKQYYQEEHMVTLGQAQLELNLTTAKLKAGMHLLQLQTEEGQRKIIKLFKR